MRDEMSHVSCSVQETADFGDGRWWGLVDDSFHFCWICPDSVDVENEAEKGDFQHESVAFARLQFETVVGEGAENGGSVSKIRLAVF